jgi:hypothetical protein
LDDLAETSEIGDWKVLHFTNCPHHLTRHSGSAGGLIFERRHDIRYVELSNPAERKKKAETKIKYTCDQCHQNAWGKSGLKLRCDPCDVPMRFIG